MPLTPTPSPASPTFVPAIDIKQQTDSNHDTALSVAAAGGHDDLVKLLLQRGSELEHRDKKGSLTSVHGCLHLTACQQSRFSLVTLLCLNECSESNRNALATQHFDTSIYCLRQVLADVATLLL